ncbi:glycosyltransferase [Xanthomonas bonasiae]|jgi:glycosyltransferase involved in cell wall biosynthesis|uniref:glycosyltransferase n=1 Tax=Xanthomonas bonasiae TaxID=2810351 RepID=UPI001F142CC3|nr:glycosyltransferase [Xanthomonas bonasiae]
MASDLYRIVSCDNGTGLSRDLGLMADALTLGGQRVQRLGFSRGKLTRLVQEAGARLAGAFGHQVHTQVFSERVYPGCLALAERNLLVPNPEWFLPQWLPLLPRFEAVLCKTRHAELAFRRLGCRTRYIGFTSRDRYDPAIPRRYAFFHLAGRSTAKGTRVLLDTWQRHPQWPQLTVVQNPRSAGERVRAGNIDHRIAYLDDAELRTLQNAHLFHLCPSEVEGFGHSLMEAMSVGAVTLTTDAEPMNELVTPARGLLLAPACSRMQRLASYHYVDRAGIEAGVERALALSVLQRDTISRAARRYFCHNDAAFATRFQAAVLSQAAPAAAAPAVERIAGIGVPAP